MLRVPETADAPDIARWCADWELARWTANIPHPYTLDDALAFVADMRAAMEAARTVTFAIERRETPGVIGMIGLMLDGLGVEGDFGWWIAGPHRGQGYASEAAAVMVDFARAMGVARLTAGAMPDNFASQGVARRIGMRPAGRMTRAAPARGAPIETLEFVLTG
ncbi:MAG: GNAT family N-acetyltransferase [Rhodospirillales bacterium]|nr:GNAT family N-acetyltransferase [Rhodospirillales bacterium]